MRVAMRSLFGPFCIDSNLPEVSDLDCYHVVSTSPRMLEGFAKAAPPVMEPVPGAPDISIDNSPDSEAPQPGMTLSPG